MPITWTAYEQCVNDRIAHYRQTYDQATRIYQKLLAQTNISEKQLADVLEFRQAMADELSRCRRLLIKYSLNQPVIHIPELVQIQPARLN
jgi:hypothetical protein